MKKIISVGILTILATVALSGCTTPAPTTTPTPVEKNTKTYSDAANDITFEYPNTWIQNVNNGNSSVASFYLDSDVLLEREKEGSISYQFISSTQKPDFSTWRTLEIDGHTAYQSAWEGIPNSGEMGKKTYIAVGDSFVFLLATKTGNTDITIIEKALQGVLDTMDIK